MEDLYEDAKYKATSLLDEILEFKDTYIHKSRDIENKEHLVLLKVEITAWMDKYKMQTKEAYLTLRGKDHMPLKIQTLKAELELEFNYFAYYWNKFHNLVTYGFPFYYEIV